MSSKYEHFKKFSPIATSVCFALTLAACDSIGDFSLPLGQSNQQPEMAAAQAQSLETVERDVEAPEVFQVEEPGLWDGRPSLGGIWVAHPSATDPERVIIRNTSNGKFVVGALFRKERAVPGPALQISSDAAVELGILAGAPANVSVTALRREKVAAQATPTATTEFDSPADVSAEPIDALAGAAAAIDAADLPASSTPVLRPKAKPVATQAATTMDKSFIQIGFFSIEANARRTADIMRGSQLEVSVIAQTVNERNFWRVLVGPAQTKQALSADLATVKGLGFSDAYAVTN